MSKFSPGERVVATKDIGGVLRDSVPKGTRGVVTEAGWMSQTRVLFSVKGAGFADARKVEVTVDDAEIA